MRNDKLNYPLGQPARTFGIPNYAILFMLTALLFGSVAATKAQHEQAGLGAQIPANEPPRLHWYHPHPHGNSEGQVQGVATGVLIVEGLQDVDTALAGRTERTFVIRDQVLPASEVSDSGMPAWDVSLNFVPVTYPNHTPAMVPTNPEQQELWRVANIAAGRGKALWMLAILAVSFTFIGCGSNKKIDPGTAKEPTSL